MTTAQRPVLTAHERDPLLSSSSSSTALHQQSTTTGDAEMGSSTTPRAEVKATIYLGDSLFRGWAGPLAQVGLLVSTIMLWRVMLMHPAGLFTYHPTLQSLAIVGFAEGVLLLQPPPASISIKRKGLQLHQLFQYTALPLILAGASVILYNKAIHHAPHFTTWHARFGLVTLVLILVQITFGAIVVYSPLVSLVGGEAKGKRLWKYHRMTGYLTLSLLILTPLLALESDWMHANSSALERKVIGGGLIVTALGVVARVQKGKLGL